ncbi:antitoxin Xre/MbcA/ParS-like domain-containing protein [Phenylobacterium sp. LjRoot225]|uniref:antitoxin Xre/MbcA/ParS-like domain-containing protein n=1 Tax=Phenylobacterium sp. LjRoot225 TaxID=3342285 RepID=UPI003F4FE2A9
MRKVVRRVKTRHADLVPERDRHCHCFDSGLEGALGAPLTLLTGARKHVFPLAQFVRGQPAR